MMAEEVKADDVNEEMQENKRTIAEFLTRFANLDDSGCFDMLDAPLRAFVTRGLLRDVFRRRQQPADGEKQPEVSMDSVTPIRRGDKYTFQAAVNYGRPALWKFELTRLQGSPFSGFGDKSPNVITRLWVGEPSKSVSCPESETKGKGARVNFTVTFAAGEDAGAPGDMPEFYLWRQGMEPGKGGSRSGLGEDEDAMAIRQKRLDEASVEKQRAALNQDMRLTYNTGRKLKFLDLSRMRVAKIVRKPGDVYCACIFAAYWIVLAVAAVWAFTDGDADRLLHGFDSQGNICGSSDGRYDLTEYNKLWWPDPLVKTRHFCVKACPTAADVNASLQLLDYVSLSENGVDPAPFLAGTQSATNQTSALVTTTVATIAVTNRCLSVGGELSTAVGGLATLVADTITGAPIIAETIVLGLGAGYLWLFLVVLLPACIVYGFIVAGIVCLAALIAVFLSRASVIDVPDSVPDNMKSSLSNEGSETVMILCAVGLALVLLGILILLIRIRRQLSLAKKVLHHGSKALRVSFGIIFMPLWNAFLLVVSVGLWGATSVHLASVGSVVQECVCPSNSLVNCTCALAYDYSVTARFFMFMHMVGLLWTMSILVHVSKMQVASVVGEWYFQDRGKLGVAPPPTTSRPSAVAAYRRTLSSHFGTICLAAAIDLGAMFQRPVLFVFLHLRRMMSADSKRTRGCRVCLGAFILDCLCFDHTMYLDVDAALVQVAVHGGSFFKSARRGYKLRRRNKERVAEVSRVITVVLLVGRTACVCLAAFIGMVSLFALQSGNEDMGVGVPVLVVVMICLAAYTAVGLCIDMYSMALESLLLNFFEDAERYGRSASMFMPGDLRDLQEYIDENSFSKGVQPTQAAEHVRRLFGPKAAFADGGVLSQSAFNKLAMKHTPEAVARLRHASVWTTRPKPEEWEFKVQRPIVAHESQQETAINVYVNEYPEPGARICCCFKDPGSFRLLRGTVNADEAAETTAVQGTFTAALDDQGNTNVGAKDMWNGAGKIVPTIRGADAPGFVHFATPGQQHSEELTDETMALRNESRLRLEVQIESLRVSRRLMAKSFWSFSGNSPGPEPNLADYPPPNAQERGNESTQTFREWLTTGARAELGATQVRRADGHSQLQFALNWFRYIQTHFYKYKEAQGMIQPISYIIKGDTGSNHSMNFLFVMGLREVGIPARCLHGLLLKSSNNTTFNKQTEGQQRTIDALQQTRSEFYVTELGWVPADATPIRHAYLHHEQARRFTSVLGRAAEDLEVGDSCLFKFGNDDGKLLLNTAAQPLMTTPGANRQRREIVVEYIKANTTIKPSNIGAATSTKRGSDAV